jgi:hypothetical protein
LILNTYAASLTTSPPLLPLFIYCDFSRNSSGHYFLRQRLALQGGVYLSVPYQDAEVYINGELMGRSGFLQRSFYTSDLAPSAYIMHVEREGYHSWDRLLVVEEQLVTDSRALLIPETIPITRLLAATTTPGQFASTTRHIHRRFRDFDNRIIHCSSR